MSLSERLRQAALERAVQSGEELDGYVLEPDGVIDLREMARQPVATVDNRVTLPPVGDDVRVNTLYAKPLSETSLWRRIRETKAEAELSVAAPATSVAAPATPVPPEEAVVIDVTEDVPVVEIDDPLTAPALSDDRPTCSCPRCGGLAERDLLDIFSATEYFSCNDCNHMWQQPQG